MEQSPSSEGDIQLASPAIPRLLLNPKFHQCVNIVSYFISFFT